MQTRHTACRMVWIRRERWLVERAAAERGITRLDVVNGRSRRTFLLPFDRADGRRRRARPIRVRRASGRARLAAVAASTFGLRTVRAAIDAAITIYPHQLEPALAMLDGHRRLLIADAVGLGKTIEAGLIVSELVRRLPACRALVIAPAGLVDQWLSELGTRFAIAASPVSSADVWAGVDQLGRGHDRWLRPGVWVGSADYLKQPHVLETMPLVPWDVVIVDEAHSMAGATDRHAAAHAICQRARRVVLLTATPHSGDAADFDRLCSLGSLSREPGPLFVFRRSREAAGVKTTRRVRWHHVAVGDAVRPVLLALDRFETAVIHAARSAGRSEAGALLVSVFWRRALSTLAALRSTIGRRLEWLEARRHDLEPGWLQPRLDFGEDDDLDLVDGTILTADVGLAEDRERAALVDLAARTDRAGPYDPKLERLRALVRRIGEPVVVFTEYRRSLEAAAGVIGPWRQTRCLHGGLSPGERRQELSSFLEGGASALVSTDVGGQGLNLQSRARWVVNLDLPWNPARLEQRIGRVDRIGQTRPVHATMLVLDHAGDARLRAALARRAEAARTAGDANAFSSFAATTTLAVRPPTATDGTAVPGYVSAGAWRHRGRALARVLLTKRALAGRWRGAAPLSSRPFLARGPLAGRRRGFERGSRATLVGFVVDLTDGLGTAIERHHVAVRIARAAAGLVSVSALLEAADQAAAEALHARVRRVERVAARALARQEATERLVAAHLEALTRRRETQLALFHRGGAPFAEIPESATARPWQGEAGLASLRAGGTVTAGSPALVWIWMP